MQCTLPPPLEEDQISDALDGAADDATLAHLARCASCAQRLNEARQVEQALRGRLAPQIDVCPEPDLLGRYHMGLAEAAEAQLIEAHLARCQRCALELHDLRAFLSATPTLGGARPTTPGHGPPASLPRQRSGAVHPGLLLARALGAPAAHAVRGESHVLSAEAGQLTILLELQPADGRLALQGQLLGDDQPGWSDAVVELRREGALAAVTHVDELGGFGAGPLEPGRYALFLSRAGGPQISWPDLELS